MVLPETEDITLKQLETYKFDSKASVTVILHEVDSEKRNEVKCNVENNILIENNPSWPNETINAISFQQAPPHLNSYSSSIQCECIPQSNLEQSLYTLSKYLILIVSKHCSSMNTTCAYSRYLDFKYHIFELSQKIIVDIVLPRENDHNFIKGFLNETTQIAMRENCQVSHSQIEQLFWEMRYFAKQRTINEKRQPTYTPTSCIENLTQITVASNFFTYNEMSSNSQSKIRKRKSTSEDVNKRKKNRNEEPVPDTIAYSNNLTDDLISYTQQDLNDSCQNVIEQSCEHLNENAVPVTIVGDMNLQLDQENCDSFSLTTPTIAFVTSLNPQRALVANGNCRICNTVTKKLCIGCLKSYYCSIECQKLEWPQHQFECYKSK